MNLPYTIASRDLQDPDLLRLNRLLELLASQINAPTSTLAIQFSGGLGFVGVAYNGSLIASGGVGTYTYAILGTLPTGLSLNIVSGAIMGTPSATGTFNFVGQATDSAGNVITTPCVIIIASLSTYAGPATVTDVTGSRALTTTYTNSNPIAMYVNVTVTLTAGGGNSVFAAVGPTTPTIDIAEFANPSLTATMTATVSFPVPSGFKYEITGATSIVKWVESV